MMDNDKQTETHLDLWKHFSDDASKINDRMWTIASWMFTLQGALLAFISSHLSVDFRTGIEVKNSSLVLIVASIGIGLSLYNIYMISQYGKHLRGMWNRADLVRRKVPGLNEIWFLNTEKKLVEDRKKEGKFKNNLPPVALRLVVLGSCFMLVFTLLGYLSLP